MKILISFVCLIISNFTYVYALECPKAPEQIKKDWEVEVNAAVLRIGPVKGAELKTKTKKAAEDLLGKLPDAGKIYLEQMMFSAYCTALRDDKTVTESEKARLLKLYRKDVIPTVRNVSAKKSQKYEPKSKSNQSFVRFKYVICTGPYNLSDNALKHRDSNYLLKNNIFRMLSENGAFEEHGGSVVSYKMLYGDEIDKWFGLNINKKNIPASQKVEMYKRYFKSISMDINLMNKLGLLPKFLAKIKLANHRYNEPLSYEISKAVHDEKTAQLTIYFRSIRVKSVLIENISNKSINHIKLHVKEYSPKNSLGLRIGNERLIQDRNWRDRSINFPIDFLTPNEGIILPLGVQLVSEQYASGYIYESDRDKSKVDVLSRAFTVGSEDIGIYKSKGVDKFLFFDNPEPVDLGTTYEVTGVEFIVDGEKISRNYSRKFDKDNLIYVNENCECGSCPILLAENIDGSWRRLREIISENKEKENMDKFTYIIPSSAKKVKIEEFKSETSYFSQIGLSIKNSSGIYCEEIYKIINGALLSVTHDNPYVIDLSDMHKKYRHIDEISITGSAYYETKSSTICPPVPILDPKLF